MLTLDETKIAVVGLGYVGLPLAVEFGMKIPVIGFDINKPRIEQLKSGTDNTLEVSEDELARASMLSYSSNVDDLKSCNVYIL